MRKLIFIASCLLSGIVNADQILAQYSVTGVNLNQQLPAIQQGINQAHPDSIVITYPGAMTFLANEISSSLMSQTKTTVTMNVINAYWSSTTIPSGQVIVNLIGDSDATAPQPTPSPDLGSFFDYKNSTQGAFFNSSY